MLDMFVLYHYSSIRQETLLSVCLELYYVEMEYFHFNVMSLGNDMPHTI